MDDRWQEYEGDELKQVRLGSVRLVTIFFWRWILKDAGSCVFNDMLLPGFNN